MQRIANPCSSVRFRVAPPVNNNDKRKLKPFLTCSALRHGCPAHRIGVRGRILSVLCYAFNQRSNRSATGDRSQLVGQRARLALFRLHTRLFRDANPGRYMAGPPRGAKNRICAAPCCLDGRSLDRHRRDFAGAVPRAHPDRNRRICVPHGGIFLFQTMFPARKTAKTRDVHADLRHLRRVGGQSTCARTGGVDWLAACF